MSLPDPPNECSLQLPTWDENDSNEFRASLSHHNYNMNRDEIDSPASSISTCDRQQSRNNFHVTTLPALFNEGRRGSLPNPSCQDECAPPSPESNESRPFTLAVSLRNSNNGKSSKLIGPAIPDFPFTSYSSTQPSSSFENSDEGDVYGPALPPNLSSHQSFAENEEPVEVPDENEDSGSNDSTSYGEVFGPIPPNEKNIEIIEQEYAERLFDFELRKREGSGVKREEWMLQPPNKKRIINASSFSRVIDLGVNEESLKQWTEIPNDKATIFNSIPHQLYKMPDHVSDQTEDTKEADKRPSSSDAAKISLLDLHRRSNKLPKDPKMGERGMRRPFDPEIDLRQTPNRFNNHDGHSPNKRSEDVGDRSGLLNSRFTNSTAAPNFL